MTDGSKLDRCQQAVYADDDCCREQICEAPATWVHREAGAALCAQHEENARKWSGDSGRWHVGKRDVPYPDGWEAVGDARSTLPDARSTLPDARSTRLTLEPAERASGLVIEREPPAER